MKEIQLTRGKVSLVDNDIYDKVGKYKWWCSHDGYAWRRINGKPTPLHRYILNAQDGQIVDHINRDKLDNRRVNLRFCTVGQNACNSKMRKDNTSGYRGVCYVKRTGKWIAYVFDNRKQINIGFYDTPEIAAKAYDHEAHIQYGEFAQLNFSKSTG
jgi:hypothetical protein